MAGNIKLRPPYKGKEEYIFISYSHRNAPAVMQVVGRLQKDGHRVWYDEGIDPGTEWDENIAQHVKDCHCFVAFLSREYLQSTNCKDELNYARELDKPRLLVYLEDVELPVGMQMRLSRLQAVHKYKYTDEEGFYEKLYDFSALEECKEAPSAVKETPTSPPAEPPKAPEPADEDDDDDDDDDTDQVLLEGFLLFGGMALGIATIIAGVVMWFLDVSWLIWLLATVLPGAIAGGMMGKVIEEKGKWPWIVCGVTAPAVSGILILVIWLVSLLIGFLGGLFS